MRALTDAERDAFARWHYAAVDAYPLPDFEREDANILANLASELFLADHFERITEERLKDIGFVSTRLGTGLGIRREGDRLECHRDMTAWALNGERLIRRLEPRYMGEVHDIMFRLWGKQ